MFLCKILHRIDSHVVNSEVVRFNELLHERFTDTEQFLTVFDTVLPEFKFYSEDGLHFSNVGLSKSCNILLSSLYRVIFPNSSPVLEKVRYSAIHCASQFAESSCAGRSRAHRRETEIKVII